MIKDLASKIVHRELVVGWLFGKVLWIKVMYRRKDLTSIGGLKLLIYYMVDKLKCLKDCPRLIFDNSFACLLEYDADEESVHFILQLAEDFLTFIERQAADYLPGGKYANMEPKILVLSKNAPADNITAETILGLHDHSWRSAPNTSNSYMAAKPVSPQTKLLIGLKLSQIQAHFWINVLGMVEN